MSLVNTYAKGNYITGVKQSIIGSKVVNPARENLGKIEDVVIDSRNNSIAYAILSVESFLGMGGKHFALPWEVVDFDAQRHEAVIDIDQERLKNAPGFDRQNWPDMADAEWAHQVHAHFGIKPDSDNSKGRS